MGILGNIKDRAVNATKSAGQKVKQRFTDDSWWGESPSTLEAAGNMFHEPVFKGGVENVTEKIRDITDEVHTSVANVSEQTRKIFAKDTKGVLRHIPGAAVLAPAEALNIVGQVPSKAIDLGYDAIKYGVGRRLAAAARGVGKMPLYLGVIPKWGLNLMNLSIYAPAKIIKGTKDAIATVLGWPLKKLRSATSDTGGSSSSSDSSSSDTSNVIPFPTRSQQSQTTSSQSGMRRAA